MQGRPRWPATAAGSGPVVSAATVPYCTMDVSPTLHAWVLDAAANSGTCSGLAAVETHVSGALRSFGADVKVLNAPASARGRRETMSLDFELPLMRQWGAVAILRGAM